MNALKRFWNGLRTGRTAVIGIPYLWLLVFFALPFVVLIRISVTHIAVDGDPFAPLYTVVDGTVQWLLRYENYLSIFRDSAGADGKTGPLGQTIYFTAYLTSLRYAAFTTVLCLILGYPFAWFIARSRESLRTPMLMMVMLPFWTSLLLRVYAWKGLLSDKGLFNRIFMALGLINEPLQMLYSDVSMLVGMTYIYLPFMVLPLYANLVKLDVRLLEAANDLGANPWKAFWLITVPLSRAGIIAGCMLVFIPALGEFVIPSLLGGAENIMIGRVVWDEMFAANNWPRASALAVIMILMILVPLALYYYYSGKQEQAQEGR
ncbi:MAG: ABC transporter permease subunit [Brachymonas sp.]|nr:ABC transporter permease subunit [Brachymonas sp.]